MTAIIRRHPDVADDIAGVAEYISHDSVDAALRFAPAAEATIRGSPNFPARAA